MKYLLALLIAFTFSGCFSTKVILVPQVQYYPIFQTNEFNTSKQYKLKVWQEEDVNATYFVTYKEDSLAFYKDTKMLRANYNLLLKKINEFNLRIEALNKKQSELKPQEVE